MAVSLRSLYQIVAAYVMIRLREFSDEKDDEEMTVRTVVGGVAAACVSICREVGDRVDAPLAAIAIDSLPVETSGRFVGKLPKFQEWQSELWYEELAQAMIGHTSAPEILTKMQGITDRVERKQGFSAKPPMSFTPPFNAAMAGKERCAIQLAELLHAEDGKKDDEEQLARNMLTRCFFASLLAMAKVDDPIATEVIRGIDNADQMEALQGTEQLNPENGALVVFQEGSNKGNRQMEEAIAMAKLQYALTGLQKQLDELVNEKKELESEVDALRKEKQNMAAIKTRSGEPRPSFMRHILEIMKVGLKNIMGKIAEGTSGFKKNVISNHKFSDVVAGRVEHIVLSHDGDPRTQLEEVVKEIEENMEKYHPVERAEEALVELNKAQQVYDSWKDDNQTALKGAEMISYLLENSQDDAASSAFDSLVIESVRLLDVLGDQLLTCRDLVTTVRQQHLTLSQFMAIIKAFSLHLRKAAKSAQYELTKAYAENVALKARVDNLEGVLLGIYSNTVKNRDFKTIIGAILSPTVLSVADDPSSSAPVRLAALCALDATAEIRRGNAENGSDCLSATRGCGRIRLTKRLLDNDARAARR